MTSAVPRFPVHPIRGVRVLHQRQNCAPHFAEITVDFEPAAEGFTFEVAEELMIEHDSCAYGDLQGLFAAAAAGMQEQLAQPEHGLVIATHVVLRQARTQSFGSHELAFKIAGYLAAREALARALGRDHPLEPDGRLVHSPAAASEQGQDRAAT
ncbi:hypothetical protein [Streptomyces sp. NPDC008001]|uniref:hypothetical protein n=1 Tax=Streptomyces sp. NPDC008001 TaxID=3364804 RepID=UPI0036EC6812